MPITTMLIGSPPFALSLGLPRTVQLSLQPDDRPRMIGRIDIEHDLLIELSHGAYFLNNAAVQATRRLANLRPFLVWLTPFSPSPISVWSWATSPLWRDCSPHFRPSLSNHPAVARPKPEGLAEITPGPAASVKAPLALSCLPRMTLSPMSFGLEKTGNTALSRTSPFIKDLKLLELSFSADNLIVHQRSIDQKNRREWSRR
jgi:hypothetical protein